MRAAQTSLLMVATLPPDLSSALDRLKKIADNPRRDDLVTLRALADTFRRANMPSKAEHAEELAAMVRG